MTDNSTDEDYLDLVQEIIGNLRAHDIPEALTLIQKGIAEYPEGAEIYLLTSVCSYLQNDIGRAIELCEIGHKLSPDCQEIVDSLAVLHVANSNLNEGIYYAKLATTLAPHPDIPDLLPLEFSDFFAAMQNATPSRHYLDGLYRYNFQVFDEAAIEFEKELRRNPGHTDALMKLAQTYIKLNRPQDSLKIINTYREQVEDSAELLVAEAQAYCHLAQFDEAARFCRQALAADPDSTEIAVLVLETSLYFDGDLHDEHLQCVEELNRRIAAAAPGEDEGEPHIPPAANERRINVAIVSNQLFDGEVATYLMPYLQHHDKQRFNVTVYQESAAGDTTFNALKAVAPNWRRIIDVEDDVVELIMARENTDVVLDLCGFSENGRPTLMAMLGNRITANMFCQPFGDGSTPGANLILSDGATAETDRNHLGDGQTTAACAGGLFAIEEPQIMGEVGELPASKNGHLTIGGTATLTHFSEHTVQLWTGALNALPSARLHLGYVENISAEVKTRILELFTEQGLADRVSVWDTDLDHRANPAYFGAVDIYLDTSPVNGTLALCHALWMGVPVVTRKGPRRASVLGASILQSAGKPEWIAEDDQTFVSIAKSLGDNIPALADIRAELRDDVKSSRLLDTRQYVRGIEQALTAAIDARRDES
ncbi:MAG: tetratricopeptide repeat protein [Rhodospirillales bacterium]